MTMAMRASCRRRFLPVHRGCRHSLEADQLQPQHEGAIRRSGYTYNATLDAFIEPKPYPSWTLNTTTADWDPPTPDPSDENSLYAWHEDTLTWVEQDIS